MPEVKCSECGENNNGIKPNCWNCGEPLSKIVEKIPERESFIGKLEINTPIALDARHGLIAGVLKKQFKLFSITNMNESVILPFEPDSITYNDLIFDTLGHTIALASWSMSHNEYIEIYNIESKTYNSIIKGQRFVTGAALGGTNRIAFSPDTSYIGAIEPLRIYKSKDSGSVIFEKGNETALELSWSSQKQSDKQIIALHCGNRAMIFEGINSNNEFTINGKNISLSIPGEAAFPDGNDSVGFALSPDASLLAVGSYQIGADTNVHIFDIRSNKLISTATRFGKAINQLCFSNQGNILLGSSKRDAKLWVWKILNKQERNDLVLIDIIKFSEPILKFSVAEDDSILVACGTGKTGTELWKIDLRME